VQSAADFISRVTSASLRRETTKSLIRRVWPLGFVRHYKTLPQLFSVTQSKQQKLGLKICRTRREVMRNLQSA
jgi:hypothetical protein